MKPSGHSVQLEFTIDMAPFTGANEASMAVANGMQRAIQFSLPEVQEFPHLGKFRSKIVVLPDIGLQNGLKMGNAV